MPIYMDRHFVEGVSRSALAEAHAQDVALGDKYGVQFLTYWFDEDRGHSFCLVDAPSKIALRQHHAEAHGQVPHDIIPVDPNVVHAFLGRVTDPTPADLDQTAELDGAGIDPAFRTIMFTDLKDSTLMAVRLGDRKAIELLRIHNGLVREIVDAHDGREVKTTGDGFLISFAAAKDAVQCAVAIQERFATYNERYPEESLLVRIGLSAGEPVEEAGDLFGSAVNMASRICDLAEGGGILAADVVRSECDCEGEGLTFADAGQVALKGFEQPEQLYKVQYQGD